MQILTFSVRDLFANWNENISWHCMPNRVTSPERRRVHIRSWQSMIEIVKTHLAKFQRCLEKIPKPTTLFVSIAFQKAEKFLEVRRTSGMQICPEVNIIVQVILNILCHFVLALNSVFALYSAKFMICIGQLWLLFSPVTQSEIGLGAQNSRGKKWAKETRRISELESFGRKTRIAWDEIRADLADLTDTAKANKHHLNTTAEAAICKLLALGPFLVPTINFQKWISGVGHSRKRLPF